MALSSQAASASALSNALLAISAFHHLGRDAAMPYKLKALRQLSDSVSVADCRETGVNMDSELAACLMLCMHSVCAATSTESCYGC